MNCKDIIEKISEYIDEELDTCMCEEIKEHIDNCPSCDSFFKSFTNNIELCKYLLKVDVPEDTRTRLRERLKEEYIKFSMDSEQKSH